MICSGGGASGMKQLGLKCPLSVVVVRLEISWLLGVMYGTQEFENSLGITQVSAG